MDNTNRGTLGKNLHKTKDTHPEYSGKLNIDGREYWLSGWVKEGPKGKFFSLSVRPKEPKPGYGESQSGSPEDEDVPF